jgi:hypothetical protein
MPNKKSSKKPVQKRTTEIPSQPRRLKQAKYKSFRFSKRIKHPVKLPNSWKILKKSLKLLWEHRKFYLLLVMIFGVINLLFVRGFSSTTDVGTLKSTLNLLFTGHIGHILSGLTVFALLITSSGNTSSTTGGVYQIILVLIVSLAIVWSLRQFMAGGKIRVRDAFYASMYPLIPVLLVLVVMAIELIPLVAGSAIYATVSNNGIAIDAVEKLTWILLFAVMALWSLYMITSAVFALYVATLPDMTPMKALKSARELVRFRRWGVLRRILFLPLILLIIAAIVMLPIIIFITPAAEWIFFILSMFVIVVVHSYMYTLYRELLI